MDHTPTPRTRAELRAAAQGSLAVFALWAPIVCVHLMVSLPPGPPRSQSCPPRCACLAPEVRTGCWRAPWFAAEERCCWFWERSEAGCLRALRTMHDGVWLRGHHCANPRSHSHLCPLRVTPATSVGKRPSTPRLCVGTRAAAGCEDSSVDPACGTATGRTCDRRCWTRWDGLAFVTGRIGEGKPDGGAPWGL